MTAEQQAQEIENQKQQLLQKLWDHKKYNKDQINGEEKPIQNYTQSQEPQELTDEVVGQIQQKEDKDIMDEEKRILECFSQLKSSDLSQEERLTLFLELCVPKDMRQLYVDRYNENNAIYNKKFTKKEELEDKISNSPVVFPIGIHLETSLRNIAITERLSSIQTDTEEIRNAHTVEETENSLTN